MCCEGKRTWCSDGADDRNRTGDPRFTIPMLYQLSYVGMCTGYVLLDNCFKAFSEKKDRLFGAYSVDKTADWQ